MNNLLIWGVLALTGFAVLALFRGMYQVLSSEFGVQVDERLIGPAFRELKKRRTQKEKEEKRARPWEAALERLPLAKGLDRRLEQANLALRVGEWMTIWALSTLGAAALGFLLTRTALTAVLMGLAGFLIPPFWLNRRIERRRQAFADQLVDTLRLLISALQAGHGLLQAMQLAAEEMPAPTSEELGRVVQEVALGYTMNDALERLVERMPNEELEMVISAIAIQSEVGGKLSDILENIVETIEERVRLQGEIRALTAQQRMSGYLITGMPFILALIISVINPGYLSPLFTPEWRWLPMVGLGMMAMGWFLMQRMLRIDV